MRRRTYMSAAVLCLLLSCAPELTEDPNDDSTAPAVSEARGLLSPPEAYFVGRQDPRRCRWPLCGGYWVRQVNRATLRCPDGKVARECYVAQLDATPAGGIEVGTFGDGRTVVRGAFGTGDAGELGPYSLLRISAAWEAATGSTPIEPLSLVTDTGLRCIQAPCFSFGVARLNSRSARTASDLDLERAGASEKQLEAAYQALSEQGLVVSERLLPQPDGGRLLVATQLFLPLRARAPDICESDDACTSSVYTAPVLSAADCYCPTCPIPMTVSEAQRNADGWQAFCSFTHGFEVCPPPPCAPPPPIGCVSGACGYRDFEPPLP